MGFFRIHRGTQSVAPGYAQIIFPSRASLTTPIGIPPLITLPGGKSLSRHTSATTFSTRNLITSEARKGGRKVHFFVRSSVRKVYFDHDSPWAQCLQVTTS